MRHYQIAFASFNYVIIDLPDKDHEWCTQENASKGLHNYNEEKMYYTAFQNAWHEVEEPMFQMCIIPM